MARQSSPGPTSPCPQCSAIVTSLGRVITPSLVTGIGDPASRSARPGRAGPYGTVKISIIKSGA
eukprot:4831-Hanusia_phi.AAC.1